MALYEGRLDLITPMAHTLVRADQGVGRCPRFRLPLGASGQNHRHACPLWSPAQSMPAPLGRAVEFPVPFQQAPKLASPCVWAGGSIKGWPNRRAIGLTYAPRPATAACPWFDFRPRPWFDSRPRLWFDSQERWRAKIGGTTREIRLGIQWDGRQKWDTISF